MWLQTKSPKFLSLNLWNETTSNPELWNDAGQLKTSEVIAKSCVEEILDNVEMITCGDCTDETPSDERSLANWQRWHNIREKEIEKLEKATNRPRSDLLMNFEFKEKRGKLLTKAQSLPVIKEQRSLLIPTPPKTPLKTKSKIREAKDELSVEEMMHMYHNRTKSEDDENPDVILSFKMISNVDVLIGHYETLSECLNQLNK